MPSTARTTALALAVAVGSACATVSHGASVHPVALAAQTPGEGERVVSSAVDSFSAVFPSRGWQIVERLPYAVKLAPGDRPLSLAAIADYVAPGDESLPVAELLQGALARELADKLQWRIAEQGEALLGGLPATRLQATALIGQTPVMLVSLGRRSGARLCYVQLTGTPQLIALGMPAFERAADTFRCTPPAGDAPPRQWKAPALAAEAQRSIEALDPTRGVALLSRAVAQAPADAALIEKLVQADLLTGDATRAVRTLKAELVQNPDRYEHWQVLASLQMQAGDPAGGLATLQGAAARPGAPATLLSALGDAYLRAGQLPNAEQSFKGALAHTPKNAEVQAALGEVYLREKKLDQAEAAEKAAIALDPARGEFHAALSEVYGERNLDEAAAAECIEALERTVPKSLEATLKYNLACFNARLGHQRDCLFWLRQALEAGFSDIEFMRRDPDLESVRDLPAFRELFEQP